MHFAAESHVDRSIDDPGRFIQSNIVGTFCLLETAFRYWRELSASVQEQFRFHHISTDEVFGSIAPARHCVETSPYAPSSPYAASKASSNHLVNSWHLTYGFPVLITNSSNNYGPYQFPEKLIPLIILNGLQGRPLPVYGKGANIRDWLYVEDHVRALFTVVERGSAGETYNIGGHNEHTNISVVERICDLLDEICPDKKIGRRRDLIVEVPDRPWS